MDARDVLDASSVICLLDDPPGSDRIAAMLDTASIGSVSVALVAAELTRRGADPREVAALLREFHLTVLPFGLEQAIDAGTSGSEASDESTGLERWAWFTGALKLGATAFTGEQRDPASDMPADAERVS